ncbi:MAG: hypothetical protein HQL41_10770 [Alphaproteobacteria bacterium]|nr:hypothetical protein [Alphaproteobacteria bacterium]
MISLISRIENPSPWDYLGMKLFDVLGGAAKAVLRSRDEHCPPHVHVGHKGEGWEAKIRFSYVDDSVSLMEVYPMRGRPSVATINAVMAEVRADLAICRSAWSAVVGDLDLVNRWFDVPAQGKVALLARRTKEAKRVRSASYDAGRDIVTLRFEDGSSHMMKAGTGEVE